MNVSNIIRTLTHNVILSLVFLLGFASMAHAEVSKENKVKAAIIFNLARFSEWPPMPLANETSSFQMCIMRGDVMHGALRTLAGKEISGKIVRILPLTSKEADTSKCRLLYLSANAQIDFDLANLAEKGVLTISDTDDFLSAGGGMSVMRTRNSLGFSINRTVMLSANIKPSSKILKLAKEVK